MKGARRIASLGVCLLELLGCGSAQTTQRVFHGQVVVGPYVEPEAYAAFAEGVYLETRGDSNGAARAYRRAQAQDPDSPGIAARLGAIACHTSLEAGLDEFQTSGIARNYSPAWAERARCLLLHGDPTRALEAARRAVMLDPSNPDANLAIARILREQGRADPARAWLLAWVLRDPDAMAYRDAIAEQARHLGDAALVHWITASGRPPLHEPDGAEDFGAAPSPAALARLAISRGEPERAMQHATLAVDANPEDADALVIALFAASLAPDEPRFADLLARARVSPVPPSAEAAAWMAALIRARVGDDAAERWLAAYRRVSAPRLDGQ